MNILNTLLKNTDLLSGAGKMALQNPEMLGAAAKLLSATDSSVGGSGGMAGLMEAFASNGMGDAISSWISSGKNLPVSAEQLTGILGNDTISQFAKSAGMDASEASASLASLLPDLIDQLTPDGAVPDSGTLEKSLASLFS
jgi:uncharacterized protein YidB (DUF937 family)